MEIRLQEMEGYAHGAIQPSAILRFRATDSAPEALSVSLRKFRSHLPEIDAAPGFAGDDPEADTGSTPEMIVRILGMLNDRCGDLRFTETRVISEERMTFHALPTLSPKLVRYNLRALNNFVRRTQGRFSGADVEDFTAKLKTRCRGFLPGGTNAASFIQAAAERRIPFKVFSNRFLIFGYGSGSAIFNSSITDRESANGVRIAKSKADTNRLLGMSGFPVAEQAPAPDLKAAVRFAARVGYPVVLKPENGRQGRGVHPCILDEAELGERFGELSEGHGPLVVERHVFGDGYRVYVYDGKVERALKRVAAHVVGDGARTIEDLIRAENLNPLRSGRQREIDPIEIDDDLRLALRKQGLALDMTPAPGRPIRLRYMTNISRGGTESDFLSRLHADNAKLCVDAARTIGLRCAGIDLISEDASKSWRSNNTVICEVNAQPQIGRRKLDLHTTMLEREVGPMPEITLLVDNNARHEAALFDKSSSRIQIRSTPKELLNNGCPAQYLTSVEFAGNVSEPHRRRLAEMLVSVAPDSP